MAIAALYPIYSSNSRRFAQVPIPRENRFTRQHRFSDIQIDKLLTQTSLSGGIR